MIREQKIERPTVAQFIQFLSQFPPDAPLRIADPDTGWTIAVIHASTGHHPHTDWVWLMAHYHEMTKDYC